MVYEKIEWEPITSALLGIWRYRRMLPPVGDGDIVSLGEGGTPLINLDNVSKTVSIRTYGKFEGANPTGSFKDRGMTVAISLVKKNGIRKVVVASTGNTAASVAAYAARAGVDAYVLLPYGKVAVGKLAQALFHGAKTIAVKANFDVALQVIMRLVKEEKVVYPLNSFNQFRLEGQKTLAFELYEQLGGMPGTVIVPVGNAGNISAIWKGFKELLDAGVEGEMPTMIGVQAEGASPLASMWERGLEEPLFTDKPETIASAIRIGRPVNWPKAVRAVRESGGRFISVSDEEIAKAHRFLARNEGLGVEPASAASLAGLFKLSSQGASLREPVVLVLTGHSLKDPDSMMVGANLGEPLEPEMVEKVILG